MKKLATKTSAYQATDGKLYKNEQMSKLASADYLLLDLYRRLGKTSFPTVGDSFRSAASWFKENPELVKLLTHYNPESKKLQTKPSDYPDYLKTRIKHGAVWESYDKWKDRSVVAQAGTGLGLVTHTPAPGITMTGTAAQLAQSITIEPLKARADEDLRPEKSVLGNVDKSLSNYPA